MNHCTECEYFKIEDGEDLCTRAVCMKTSVKGRTINWRMTYCYTADSSYPRGLKPSETAEDYLKEIVGRRKIPKWCPEHLG